MRIILILLLSTLIFGQSGRTNYDRIYDFLERQDLLGNISINNHIKPYSRKFIAKKLIELKDLSPASLSKTDLKELEYFYHEYLPEITKPKKSVNSFLSYDEYGRFNIYGYKDSLFEFNLVPNLGLIYEQRGEGKSTLTYWNGFNFYGTITDNVVFDAGYLDVSYKGDFIDGSRLFDPNTGFEFGGFKRSTNSFNSTRTYGNLTYCWNWGEVFISKDHHYWGTGYNGNLILSDKAPSFPHFGIKVYPAEWIEFVYINGFLNSAVQDSATLRTGILRDHVQLVDKYYAAHMVSFRVFDDLRLSLGESVVYSDQYEAIYLIPFIVFRAADHNLTVKDINAGNAQIFGSLSWNIPIIKARLDASLFIDELSISDIGGQFPEAVAFNAGITKTDLIMENLTGEFEYTRVNPNVYEHADAAQTYYNRRYQMGHWIGSNADQFYVSLKYTFFRGLRSKLSYEFTRRGDFVGPNDPLYQDDHLFLFGQKGYFSKIFLGVEYEWRNHIFVTLNITNHNAWGGSNRLDIEDYRYFEASVGLRVGIMPR